MWAVVFKVDGENSDFICVAETARFSRNLATYGVRQTPYGPTSQARWKALYREGWRVVEVEVTEVKKTQARAKRGTRARRR
jgi:hypothetical protein